MNIIIQYFEWHFFDALKGILRGWKNYLNFNLNYWSVHLLAKTFFSHWRRYKYSYGKGFSFKRYFEVFTFNMLSRTVGIIMRSVLVVLGILSEVFVFLAGFVVVLAWILMPVIFSALLYYGFKALI
ncbi:MAG: hypothetical protein ABH805_00225 [Candidatus Nealsonbacteria bacterium]